LTVIEFVFEKLFPQLYDPPGSLGTAVNVVLSPLQIVELDTLTVGIGLTVTVP
jgi:hypothetical protein